MAVAPTTITIVMTTYVPTDATIRAEYAVTSASALVTHLTVSDPTYLKLHVADDTDPPYDNKTLLSLGSNNNSKWLPTTTTHSLHTGVGGSLNAALEYIHTPTPTHDLWLYTTDDWVLTKPLSLDIPMALITNFGYDLVRLGPIHPNLCCATRFHTSVGYFLEIENDYGFAFATRPFLSNFNLLTKVGPFPTNVDAYATERMYADRVAKSSLSIAAINLNGPWAHIGDVEVGYRQVK